MSNQELIYAYVAGLLDGEGSIVIGVTKPTLKNNRKSPGHWLYVGITNTDENVIKWLHQIFGGHISNRSHNPSRRELRPIWTWGIKSNEAKKFLETVYPFLRIKQQQANIAIAFQNERAGLRGFKILSDEVIEKREWYREQLRKLTLGKHSF